MLTIDASVWITADAPAEAGHAESRALLDRVAVASIPVFVPTLLRVELAATLSRSRGDAAFAYQYASELLRLPFVIEVPLDVAVVGRATLIAAFHRLRGADAVYAAVAQLQGCVLVSLDNQHLTRLGAAVRVLTPAAALPLVTPGSP